jgi:integrase
MLVRFVGRDHPRPWNKGLLVGQKKPLQPKHVWSIRVRLEIARMWRDLVLFNLAIDSKLRACDLVKLRIDDVCSGAMVRDRATVVQKKTGRPVQFEITEQTRASLEVWLRMLRTTGSRYLFPSRLHTRAHLSTRQYARLVHRWVDTIGLESIFYGTIRCGGRRSLKSIARLATFVLSSSYSAIQNWRAPSVISGSR